MKKTTTTTKRVLLFPFMAQGHLIPFSQLAHLISLRNNHSVTLVNTHSNILTLRSILPSSSTVRLSSLPFNPSDHGLPPGHESTDSLPFHLFTPLFLSTESLRPAFTRFVSDALSSDPTSPLSIIADPFLGWTVDVAKDLGVFHAFFLTSGAWGSAVFLSLWTHHPLPWSDSGDLVLPNRPNVRLHRSQVTPLLLDGDADNNPEFAFFHRQIAQFCKSDGLIVNTAEGFERSGVEFLKEESGGMPVWAVGPLLRVPSTPSSDDTHIGWLAGHPPASVLYVSFGSMNTISASQMVELAMGLEASGTAFMWVIRPPSGFDFKGGFREEWLPEGFEERMREQNRGVLIHGWAPQMEILSHGSTGAFLSHCGWNSVLESLCNGVPIIGWPIAGEQFYNSMMMVEEIGVCVEIARGNGNESVVCREDVERIVRSVMMGGEGEEMRRKAREVGEVLRAAVGEGGASVRAMDDFLHTAALSFVR
ncbi:UDP-glycosyltransferase 92A1 [Acorus gramineus]|uniref:Glycosyltransferase n=1 Tax=Acorus gramineus TaxID=55184 RepID=A0AAV9APR0_ACOGR|nr:UDP-glycosyltransferase 92A1 [Acorus gramineus]